MIGQSQSAASLVAENDHLRRQNRTLRLVTAAALLVTGGVFLLGHAPPSQAEPDDAQQLVLRDKEGKPRASVNARADRLDFTMSEREETPKTHLSVNESGMYVVLDKHKKNPRTQLNVGDNRVGLLVVEGAEGIPRTQLGLAKDRVELLVVEGTEGFPRTLVGMNKNRIEIIITEEKQGGPKHVITWTKGVWGVLTQHKDAKWMANWDGTKIRVIDK